MSAPSPMCRARLFVVLAVAVFMSAVAPAAPDTPAPAQGKAVQAPSAHPRATPHSTPHARRRSAARHKHREPARTSVHRTSRASAAALHGRTPRRARREIAGRSRRETEPRRSRLAEGAGSERAGSKSRPDHARAGRVLPHRSNAVDAAPAEASAGGPEESRAVSRRFTREASLRIARGGMPPPLRGSMDLLERQNDRLQADGLERIEDEQDLSDRIAHHLLVPIPASDALTVNDQLLLNHRYCRPWTAQFLTDLARAHEDAFHRPLDVTSAVRPVSYQERLMRINGNAAPAEGDIVSPHVMGATIDIGKKGLSWREIAWMRRRLLALEDAGKIDVEEEFHQSCFHISVYRSYLPARGSAHTTEAQEGAAKPGAKPAAPMPVSLGTDSNPGGQ